MGPTTDLKGERYGAAVHHIAGPAVDGVGEEPHHSYEIWIVELRWS
jgi:hypothetical protein